MQLRKGQELGAGMANPKSDIRHPKSIGRPWLVLVTLVPLVWLVSVTFTAGVQKIWHSDPRIGFLSQAAVQTGKIETAKQATNTADPLAHEKAAKELKNAIRLYANNMIDAVVAGIFLLLATAVLAMSLREWVLLIARKKLAELRETPPSWLPDYALAEAKPLHLFSFIALGFALARELSGEADFERAQQLAARCECTEHQAGRSDQGRLFAAVTNERYRSVRRCC
jgi:carbon starvation protein